VLDCGAGTGGRSWSRPGTANKWCLGLAAKGDKKVAVLTELKGWTGSHVGRLSQDGKKVLYTDADPEDEDAYKWGVSSLPYLLEVATGKRTEVAEFPDNAQCYGLAWSPDGKRIAYTWKQLHPDQLRKNVMIGELIVTKGCLVIAEADGKNPKRVVSAKQKDPSTPVYGSIDWR
jgi:hypothetical protein